MNASVAGIGESHSTLHPKPQMQAWIAYSQRSPMASGSHSSRPTPYSITGSPVILSGVAPSQVSNSSAV
jgi:hypothetical protein